MKMKKALAALVATTLVGTPVVAQAAVAEGARIGSPMSDSEELRGGFIIPLIAVIAIILGVLAATGSSSEVPHSP
jgi:hypothetical protein